MCAYLDLHGDYSGGCESVPTAGHLRAGTPE